MSWNRLFWGVMFTGASNESFLLGDAWCKTRPYPTTEMPSRALLFRTRQHARDWCRSNMSHWAQYPDGDPVRKWRVSPVRVRESVEVSA